MPEARVFLALGANLGDARANIAAALERLAGVPGVHVRAVSELIETAPVDAPAGSPIFVNGVAELATSLSPHALLEVCRQIEVDSGRDLAAPRNAPRTLDLDILLFGDLEIDTRDLRIPHPQMFEREFVMRPLAELIDVSQLAPVDRPEVIRDPAAMAQWSSVRLAGGCTLGLVPTMGALHEGHISLMRMARAECDRVIATVFVNPLQFAPDEDLEDYPRTFDPDLAQMRTIGVDVVFVPAPSAMYDEGFSSTVEVGREAETMEGASRPSHFEGVTTVVAKLFNLARPTRAYFGAKDCQQVAVLRRMVHDLSYPVELRIGPIVREADGLAMSSRNRYLSDSDRAAATVLIRALRAARACHGAGERDSERLLAAARELIDAEPNARLDYLELRRVGDLQPLPDGPVEDGCLLVAAYFGAGSSGVRLLDNLTLVEPG